MLGLRPNTTLRLGLRLKLHYFYFSDTLVMPETNISDKAEQAKHIPQTTTFLHHSRREKQCVNSSGAKTGLQALAAISCGSLLWKLVRWQMGQLLLAT